MRNTPHRILHVFGNMGCGGAETRIMDLYRYIDRAKIQFDFLVLEDGKHYYTDEIEKLGGKIFSIRHPRISPIGHLLDLYKVMKNEGPYQAIHSHTSYHSGLCLLVARIAGIPYRIGHARTTSTQRADSFRKKLMISLGRKLILINSTSLLAISKTSAEFLFGNKVAKTQMVEIVPNAINLELYSNTTRVNVIQLRKRLDIPEDALIIGHVGRFSFMKNHKFILEIAEHLKARNVAFRIVLVGDGEMRAEIEKSVAELRLDDYIQFLGIRNDIPQLMQLFDLLIMPSLYEGLGGVVIEAQAAGTQCFVSDSLPREVDMEIGLVEFLPLSSAKIWVEKLVGIPTNPRVDREQINLAFERREFTLHSEEKALKRAYGLMGN